jgi:hypothetical protein
VPSENPSGQNQSLYDCTLIVDTSLDVSPACQYHSPPTLLLNVPGQIAVFSEIKKKLIYLLTPWSRVLLEKLTGLKLVKKLPAFYATRRFITAFKTARQMSLS